MQQLMNRARASNRANHPITPTQLIQQAKLGSSGLPPTSCKATRRRSTSGSSPAHRISEALAQLEQPAIARHGLRAEVQGKEAACWSLGYSALLRMGVLYERRVLDGAGYPTSYVVA